MRFDATLPEGEPVPEVGARVSIAGDRLLTEWDTSTGRGTSLVPRRITGEQSRMGTVLEVREQRIYDPYSREHAARRTLVLEDARARLTATGVILSVVGPKMLCPFVDLASFLDWLANTSLRTEQYPDVAEHAEPWLREEFPEIASAARHVPDYDTEAQYMAWVDGVAAMVGEHRLVPLPPGGAITPGPSLASDPEAVIEQARARLRGEVPPDA